jgi:hypothetical protein
MMHTRTGSALIVLAFCGASAFAADTQLLNLVMPDAQVMAGINVTNAETTPFGQYLLAKLTSNDAGLQTFITQTGFDPTKDVTELLAASSGITAGTPASHSGLLLAKGSFNVTQLLAALSKDTNHQVSTYGGATLITSTKGADNFGCAFLGATIAIAGDLTSVKAAIDRSSGVNSISPALAAQVQALSTSEDAWSVSVESLGALIPGGVGTSSTNAFATQTLQIVKNIQSASSGVKFGANVQFTAQAVSDTPQDATSLADVIKMVAGLASMSAAGQTGDGPAIGQLLQSLQVTTTGATVNISASVPETQIESILSAQSRKADAPRARKL